MTGTASIGRRTAVPGPVCRLPQVIKAWRARAVDDLSWLGNRLLFASLSLGLTYGLNRGGAPLMLSGIVGVLCIGALLVAKLRWGRR